MAKNGVAKAGSAGTKAAALTRARGAGLASAGSALLAASRPHRGAGVGAAGSALLGKAGGGGARSGPGAAATTRTQTATTAPAAPPTVQPFLTPDQQKALNDWNFTYGQDIGKLGRDDKDAWAKWTVDTGTENLKFANNNDLTNQSEAARGLFQSSIRMNALNDLAVTHATAINTINTNRDTILSNDQITRQGLVGENTGTQDYFSGLAVQNAQSVTPVTGDNAGVAGTAAAQHPGAAAGAAGGAAQHPLSQTLGQAGSALTHGAAALEQPRNTGLAATGHVVAMHSAALTRVQQPKQPKAPGSGKVGLNIGPWAGLGGAPGRVGAPR